MTIDFHRTFPSPSKISHITAACNASNSLFRGQYHQMCSEKMANLYRPSSCFLTSSCTEAILMATMILELGVGDEVIISSFTFVSVANVLINRGCIVRFADCNPNAPTLNFESVKSKVNSKTKAIIEMYYGGFITAGQQQLRSWCHDQGLWFIADAAHALLGNDKSKPMGLEADITVFSFHETKAIQCGQGGMLLLNIAHKEAKAIEIYHHGTDKYNNAKQLYQWTNEGLEFNLNELSCAVLWSQLEFSDEIAFRYQKGLEKYFAKLEHLKNQLHIVLPNNHLITDYQMTMMYLIINTEEQCNGLRIFLLEKGIEAKTHYYPLHLSNFYQEYPFSEDNCPHAAHLSSTLLRLPIYAWITEEEINTICNYILEFYETKATTLV